jgi:hypothetical protein
MWFLSPQIADYNDEEDAIARLTQTSPIFPIDISIRTQLQTKNFHAS